MTVHISARLAWHDHGWDGCVCRNPRNNTYCWAQNSFLRVKIARDRDVEWEQSVAGAPIHSLDRAMPCAASINAFGAEPIHAYEAPPTWFRDDTLVKRWTMPPRTIATWPYEEMYRDEVLKQGGNPRYDPVKRREGARAFFEAITPGRSLIFYYANYANPLNQQDERRYVLVGASRVREIGPELTWENQSERTRERYNPCVWLRNVTSCYPDQGLRIPYHLYKSDLEMLDRILIVPENPRSFKYATRHISDDGALGLIEQLSKVVATLQEHGDASENWPQRESWLASVMAELWRHRGLYPGLLSVLDYLDFPGAVRYATEHIPIHGDVIVKESFFAFLDGAASPPEGVALAAPAMQKVRRRWQLLLESQRQLLRETLPRFDLTTEQIKAIVDKPTQVSVDAGWDQLTENPYLLAEQYLGMSPDDQVSFSRIDRGLLPSTELGGTSWSPDDWQRLRALCVTILKQQQQHTFLPAEQTLADVNRELSFLPVWKQAEFTVRHLEVDQGDLELALVYRTEGEALYLYLKPVFEDERIVEQTFRQLTRRSDIALRTPVTSEHWLNWLYDSDGDLACQWPHDYEAAVRSQLDVCQRIFRRPVSVICGAAGTGKTTVIKALIGAIERAHGQGASFQLLAPTGKAADQLREKTGKSAATVHSFLARLGWLNDNLTVKRAGGSIEEGTTTIIVDEASMLDLSLIAALFRAVNWNTVQRLVLVGDPNQLPPIGTGKVFADLIDWLRTGFPDQVAELRTNMRQLENRLSGRGTGILDLASLYVRREQEGTKSASREAHEETILGAVQHGGDVDRDLRVLYWSTSEELEKLLLETIVSDMEADTGQKLDREAPYVLWNAFLGIATANPVPERSQVISPYRGESYGIVALNSLLQRHKGTRMLDSKGNLGGITYFDKVIQVINRPRSRPLYAYEPRARRNTPLEVYNGEIGVVKVHGYDANSWKRPGFILERFQVSFSRKQEYWVNYESESDVEENLEPAYAISVHKAQGSEFDRVYFVLPKGRRTLLSRELFYTGLTRARRHCTLLVQEDITPILSLRRLEQSQLLRINSSLFAFRPMLPEFQTMSQWYEEGKVHRTLANHMVRSKSEVIIANMLFESGIPFEYEVPLFANDGTFYLPDFTLRYAGDTWYWEHLGMLDLPSYRQHWDVKQAWYQRNGYSDRLIVTQEHVGFGSVAVQQVLLERFA